jgi:hypothetical protein
VALGRALGQTSDFNFADLIANTDWSGIDFSGIDWSGLDAPVDSGSSLTNILLGGSNLRLPGTTLAGQTNPSTTTGPSGSPGIGQASTNTTANWWENIITSAANTGLSILKTTYAVPNLPTGSSIQYDPKTGQPVAMTNVGSGSNVSPLALSSGLGGGWLWLAGGALLLILLLKKD